MRHLKQRNWFVLVCEPVAPSSPSPPSPPTKTTRHTTQSAKWDRPERPCADRGGIDPSDQVKDAILPGKESRGGLTRRSAMLGSLSASRPLSTTLSERSLSPPPPLCMCVLSVYYNSEKMISERLYQFQLFQFTVCN